MAYAAVSSAIEIVGDLLIQEGKFLYGVRDEVEKMQIELKSMQCFLKDAESRTRDSDSVRNWVLEIREAAYDVEVLIERFVLKSALRNRKGVLNHVKKYASSINHTVELHQEGSRIVAIKAKLNNLRTRLQTYGIKLELRVGGEEAAASGSRRKRQDYAHVVDHNVVGLDGKIKELVEHLLDVKEASVICLYGMGGLGKTTTAKKVYNDSRIRAHFKGFAWIYVSQQCNHRQIWESILSQLSANKEAVKSMTEDELTSRLCNIQKKRKCLLVVDDIWSGKDWVKLSPAFSNLEKDTRSKILLTSRNQSVTPHGGYITSLDVLNHHNSLELLKNTTLFLGGPNHPLRENLSMHKSAGEMVKQCAGLPLAIVVLGGILATKYELKEWEKVGVSIKLFLKRGEQKGNDGVTTVLESSYEDLPYYLKPCFLCFSQYLEDEEIKATELIQRWIGEGFVPSSPEDGDETMEDVAEGYLNELVSRCMIQVGRRGHTRRVKTCRMHDLMRDMCISKAKEERFVHPIDLRVKNEGTILERASIRRLFIFSGESSYKVGRSMLSSLGEISPQLRFTLFRDFDDRVDDDQVKAAGLIIKKLKLVRILELSKSNSYSSWKIWRGHIGNLIHLRLLKIRYGIPKLPTSISNLRCLQTLKLENCASDLEIPDSVWGMEQLRHLYLPQIYGGVCESSKQRVSNLQKLQTLVNFPPKRFNVQQNLVKLTSLRKLVINYNWKIEDKISGSQEIVFARLQSLSFKNPDNHLDLEDMTRSCPHLYRLVIAGTIKNPDFAAASCSSIWPSNLTKLVLQFSHLDGSHMGPLAKLQSLKVLFLEIAAFSVKEMVFHENDFPQLHHLKLESLYLLEAWSVHEGALPSLFCLEITDCKKLESVPDGSQFLKQLKELKVQTMPYTFKKRLQQGGEDWDRVSHVPSISFINCDPAL